MVRADAPVIGAVVGTLSDEPRQHWDGDLESWNPGILESGSWIWISSEGKSTGPTKSADDTSHVAAEIKKFILHTEIPRSLSFLDCPISRF